jgi:hypothetical protein
MMFFFLSSQLQKVVESRGVMVEREFFPFFQTLNQSAVTAYPAPEHGPSFSFFFLFVFVAFKCL